MKRAVYLSFFDGDFLVARFATLEKNAATAFVQGK
jgi:hypothetical protein